VDAILRAMQRVLDRMLQLEDFNKVIDQLREIIHAQERLGEETKRRQKQKLRDLLED
jgi:reverse gyrase